MRNMSDALAKSKEEQIAKLKKIKDVLKDQNQKLKDVTITLQDELKKLKAELDELKKENEELGKNNTKMLTENSEMREKLEEYSKSKEILELIKKGKTGKKGSLALENIELSKENMKLKVKIEQLEDEIRFLVGDEDEEDEEEEVGKESIGMEGAGKEGFGKESTGKESTGKESTGKDGGDVKEGKTEDKKAGKNRRKRANIKKLPQGLRIQLDPKVFIALDSKLNLILEKIDELKEEGISASSLAGGVQSYSESAGSGRAVLHSNMGISPEEAKAALQKEKESLDSEFHVRKPSDILKQREKDNKDETPNAAAPNQFNNTNISNISAPVAKEPLPDPNDPNFAPGKDGVIHQLTEPVKPLESKLMQVKMPSSGVIKCPKCGKQNFKETPNKMRPPQFGIYPKKYYCKTCRTEWEYL